MDELSPDRIRQALADVRHPAGGQSVVALGMVSGIVIKGRNVGFALEVPAADAQKLEPLRRACEDAVKNPNQRDPSPG